MRSVREASAYCTIEIESERESEKEPSNFDISPSGATVSQFSSAEQHFHEGIRSQFVDGQPVGGIEPLLPVYMLDK